MKQKSILLMLAVCLMAMYSWAQTSHGILNGRVTDSITGEGIGYANVVIQISDFQQKGTSTDADGYFTIKPIPPGRYDVLVSHMSYGKKTIQKFQIKSNQVNRLNFEMTTGTIVYKPVDIFGDPLVSAEVGSITTISREKLEKMPERDITIIVEAMSPGVTKGSFKGQRQSASAYYVDGVKVRGNPGVPNGSIQEIQVITGALPAEYGDVLGGVVVITTRSGLYAAYY